MAIIACDPSLRGCGIVRLDSDVLMYTVIKAPQEDILRFRGAFLASCHVRDRYEAFLGQQSGIKQYTVFESPPPSGQMAPMLWMLDALLVRSVFFSNEVAVCSPLMMKSLHGSRNAKKQDSVRLAKSFESKFNKIPVYSVEGTTATKSSFEKLASDHNVCEAFLIGMSFAYIHRIDLGFQFEMPNPDKIKFEGITHGLPEKINIQTRSKEGT